MQCPFCGQDRDKVVDSRSSEGGRAIRRRRQCLVCKRRFTTYERPEEGIRLKVVKKDGTAEMYEREKVILGVQKACYKRPILDEDVHRLVEDVEDEMLRRFDREVPATAIGEMVSDRLRELDKIAYVRFASVYRNFADVGELIEDARQAASPGPGARQRKLFDELPVPEEGEGAEDPRTPARDTQ